jgi:hypothetical protein
MPNLSAILEKYPQIKAAITQDDGRSTVCLPPR